MKHKEQNLGSCLTNKMSTDDLVFLGGNSISLYEWFQIFQRNVVPSSSRVSSARGCGISDCLTPEDESNTIPQNWGTSHPMTWRHVTEDLVTGSFNATHTDSGFLLHLICMSTYYILVHNIDIFPFSTSHLHHRCLFAKGY
jgi:hypothetical protein